MATYRDKAAVLIDGGYLDKILQDFGNLRIYYDAFSDKLCHESGPIYRLRTYYFNCLPFQSHRPTEEEKQRYADAQRFIYTLNRLPRFQVRLGKLQRIPDPTKPEGFDYKQKRIDVLLSVDLVRLSTERQIQKAILVTGDSDFVPSVEVAKNCGVEVWLWHGITGSTRVHDELLGVCDECRVLTRSFFDDLIRP